MRKLKATGLSIINQDNNGKVYDLVIIRLGNAPAIVRNKSQFLIDLQESALIGKNVTSLNHPLALDVIKDLKEDWFTVRGEIKSVKAGEMWTVTENSIVVKDKNHPKYGTVVAGDSLPYEKDATIVTEGFLNISVNPIIRQENKIALSTGNAYAQLLQTAQEVDTGATYGESNETPEFDASSIPDDVLAEATAGASTEEVAEEEGN